LASSGEAAFGFFFVTERMRLFLSSSSTTFGYTSLTQLHASMENFLAALRQSAKNLEVVERQKVVRLVIKQIVVNGDALTIHHSIPISRSNESQPRASYALCTRRHRRPLRRAFFAGFPFSLFHYSRFEPLSDQSHHALIPNPMLEKPLQPFVVDGVEVSTYVRIQHPNSLSYILCPPRSRRVPDADCVRVEIHMRNPQNLFRIWH